MVQIEQYGPYGSQLPETFRMQLAEGEHISGCSVRHGYIVDAIAFVVTKHDGSTYTVQFGGNGGDETDIKLVAGEYLTRLSGTYGNYADQNNEVLIGKLKIHTNLNPAGYGPYGQGRDLIDAQTFHSPDLTDGPIVGIFGRNNNYLDSIGIFVRTEFPSA